MQRRDVLKGVALSGLVSGLLAHTVAAVAQDTPDSAAAKALAELAQWYAEGKVKPVIDQRLPMQDLMQAFERMGSRKVHGKLVMVNPA